MQYPLNVDGVNLLKITTLQNPKFTKGGEQYATKLDVYGTNDMSLHKLCIPDCVSTLPECNVILCTVHNLCTV